MAIVAVGRQAWLFTITVTFKDLNIGLFITLILYVKYIAGTSLVNTGVINCQTIDGKYQI